MRLSEAPSVRMSTDDAKDSDDSSCDSSAGAPASVAISDITIVVEWRRALDASHVRDLAEAIDELPPVTLSADLRLVDGEHRVSAHMLAGRDVVPALVLPAGLSEVELLARAIEANTRHGRGLSGPERTRMTVQLLVAGWTGSDAELARRCGVSRGRLPELRRGVLPRAGPIDDALQMTWGSRPPSASKLAWRTDWRGRALGGARATAARTRSTRGLSVTGSSSWPGARRRDRTLPLRKRSGAVPRLSRRSLPGNATRLAQIPGGG